MVDVRPMVGEWGQMFNLENVAVHLHLLPTGEVMYWGRRMQPINNMDFWSLHEHNTYAYILNLETLESRRTKGNPCGNEGGTTNLFCAGHTFLPDGTLLIVGGHILDGMGDDQSCVFDPWKETFTPGKIMVAGRWYPTTITLGDGRALVISGSTSNINSAVVNLVPQVWDSYTGEWGTIQSPLDNIFSLYPRIFHVPDGRLSMAGPLARSYFLDMTANDGAGQWSDAKHSPLRDAGAREYAGATMYEPGKIIYVGGGGGDKVLPTNQAEIIDLNDKAPKWKKTSDIGRGRRHTFATTIADGTVLVTAGTAGLGFNDLSPGMPAHEAELWDPKTGKWTVMASEEDDRGYHHTALLLPDGRVLSSGGGEWAPDDKEACNDPEHTKITAQIFSPPYLFKGERPTVTSKPDRIDYKTTFEVTVAEGDEIARVSFERLGSVTHSHNHNQSFQFLEFEQKGTKLTITAPTNKHVAPPGHYMLFVLSKEGVPAVAPIILLNMDPGDQVPLLPPNPPALYAMSANTDTNVGVTIQMRNQQVISEQTKSPIVVGIKAACPYGLGPCWGGAFEALNFIKEVGVVRPEPNAADSLAFVYLKDDIIPNIEDWQRQVSEIDGGTYQLRGIEMTLTGTVTMNSGKLTLAHISTRTSTGTSIRTDLPLRRFEPVDKLEWDNKKKIPKPISSEEYGAYAHLFQTVVKQQSGVTLQVTGRLHKDGDKYSLAVKGFVEEDAS